MNKLAIIVPYRDREAHLKKFAAHMKNFLSKQDLDWKIFVVEQCDEKPFNRAKLLNVGFSESVDECDYFCFHDVDLLPVNDDCDYSYFAGVCKLSYYVSQFNFVPRPTNELGGATMFNKASYIKVNGYSNEYWGWGVEDNDLGERCRRKDIPFLLRKGRYMSLPHKPNGDTTGGSAGANTAKNREHFRKIATADSFFDSGLSNLNYEKLSEQDCGAYTLIRVSL